MKSLLRSGAPSVFVFLCIALLSMGISGGPIYGGNVNVTGTYAGSFHAPNSLGLFTVDIPKSGLGTGTASLFLQGLAYNGNMQATADPDSGRFNGYADTGFNYISVLTSTDSSGKETQTSITVRAVATGSIKGKITASGPTATTRARLNGKAFITFDPASAAAFGLPPSLTYKVVGYKQTSL